MAGWARGWVADRAGFWGALATWVWGQKLQPQVPGHPTPICDAGVNVSLPYSSIQDLSDHGTSNESRESTLEVDSSVPLTHHDTKDLGLICLIKKCKIRFGFFWI